MPQMTNEAGAVNEKLPPLPALEATTERVEVWGLMQDYARQAMRADRERIAAMCNSRKNMVVYTVYYHNYDNSHTCKVFDSLHKAKAYVAEQTPEWDQVNYEITEWKVE